MLDTRFSLFALIFLPKLTHAAARGLPAIADLLIIVYNCLALFSSL